MKIYILIIIFIFLISLSLFFLLKKENFIINLGLGKLILNDVQINRIMKTSLEPIKSQLYLNNTNIQLPSFFMYKPKILSYNEDQGVCGSCWAFATCNVLSDRASIKTNGVFKKRLSVQQVISCIKNGCDGGNPEDVFTWFLNHKLYTEEKYKYLQEHNENLKSNCNQFKSDNDESFSILQNSISSLTEFIPEKNPNIDILNKNILNMKLELFLNGPFYSTINIYGDFISFTGTEVYKHNKNEKSEGGHAIEIIGYCNKNIDKRDGFKEGYWICRNSWSKDWPVQTNDKGYFAILMGKNECGIESRCCKADLNIITEEILDKDLASYKDINSFYTELPPECSFNTIIDYQP